MSSIKLVGARGRDNITRIELIDGEGLPFNLDDVQATSVDLIITVDNQNAAIPCTWSTNQVDVRLGDFNVSPGTYRPKLVYYSSEKTNGEVLLGSGFETEILLTLIL